MLIHHEYFLHVSGPTRSHQAQNRLNFVMERSRGTTVTCFTKVLDLTRLSRASFRRPALLKKNFDFSWPRGVLDA